MIRDSHLTSDIGGGALGSLRGFGGGTIDLDHTGASIACGQLKRQPVFFPFLETFSTVYMAVGPEGLWPEFTDFDPCDPATLKGVYREQPSSIGRDSVEMNRLRIAAGRYLGK